MYIEISTNIGCKNNCSFCPQSTIVSSYQKSGGKINIPMKMSVLKTCIDKLPKGLPVTFCGMSEPWLNPKCTDMVVYTYKKGHPVTVYTTLVGMNIKDVLKLTTIEFPNGPHGFIIHLPSEEKLEIIKINNLYMKILDTIHSSKIPAQYHYHGKHLNFKIAKYFENKNALIYKIKPHSRAGNLKNQILRKRYGVIGCKKIRDTGATGFILLPNGTVVLCCQDYSMKHILGNLLNQSFQDILESKEYRNILEGMKDEKKNILCRYCEHSYNINLKAKMLNNTVKLHKHVS